MSGINGYGNFSPYDLNSRFFKLDGQTYDLNVNPYAAGFNPYDVGSMEQLDADVFNGSTVASVPESGSDSGKFAIGALAFLTAAFFAAKGKAGESTKILSKAFGKEFVKSLNPLKWPIAKWLSSARESITTRISSLLTKTKTDGPGVLSRVGKAASNLVSDFKTNWLGLNKA